MKIAYEYTFPLPRDVVWRYIQDQAVLQHAIPGCKSLERQADGLYHAVMGIHVGPIKGEFSGEVQQVEQQEPDFYRLLVRGKGIPGEIDAVADMHLEEVTGTTKLTCSAEVKVTGVLASVGQRVMGGVAKLILGQFFKAADQQMQQLSSSH